MYRFDYIPSHQKNFSIGKLAGLFSLAFMLAFSPVFAQQSIQEEEVKTEERCLIGTSAFQATYPFRSLQANNFSPVSDHFDKTILPISRDVLKRYVLHCQWIFYE